MHMLSPVFVGHRERKRSLLVGLASLLVIAQIIGFAGQARAAACAAPSTDYGSVTSSVTVPAAATYRVWTRLNVPDSANNNYLLEIDGNKCYTVGGASIAANTWTWVAYQNGNTASKIDVSLTQGAHSLKLIGNKPSVKVDRLVFASDLNCVPQGASGNECNAAADNTAPTVRLTAPAANASVHGTTTVTATASDNTAVTKVELYINSSLLGVDTSSPYSFSWDTTKLPNDSQLLTAKAYDSAGNIGTDSFKVLVLNGDQQPPSVPNGLSAKATSYNSMALSWKASTDNIGVKGYNVFRDGVPIDSIIGATSYADKNLSANTAYSYKVSAFDAAGNTSAVSDPVSAKTLTVADSQPPSQPTELKASAVSTSQINLTWKASTDTIGVVGYDIYRQKTAGGAVEKVGTAQKVSFGDTGLATATSYTYYVVARDGSNNTSSPSDKVIVKTLADPVTNGNKRRVSIYGNIRDTDSRKLVAHASTVVLFDEHRHVYQATSLGAYAIQNIEANRYTFTFRANGYYSSIISLNLSDGGTVTKDITLQKR